MHFLDKLANVTYRRYISDKEITTKFLADGAPVNCMFIGRIPLSARNPSGYPIPRYPIEVAARRASLDIVKLLVDRGANLTNTNALHNAVIAHVSSRDSRSEEETVQVMEYLLSQGCDINRREFQGEDFIAPFTDADHRPRKFGTPLQYAVYHAYEESVKFLLEHGPDPTIPAYNSSTTEYYGTALDRIPSHKKPNERERLRSILILWMKEKAAETATPSEK
jgi:hypothetical protein